MPPKLSKEEKETRLSLSKHYLFGSLATFRCCDCTMLGHGYNIGLTDFSR